MLLIHSNLTTQAARLVLSLVCNSKLVDVNTCCAVNGQLVITRPMVALHNRIPSIYLLVVVSLNHCIYYILG